MTEQVDYVVVGLGGLGSAAAWELARRGHRVLGLERFELGHARGASHDTSRILRHSYHTPGYVRLTLEAYDDWARLEHESGESLVTKTGGLDLFPPDPAIAATTTRSRWTRSASPTSSLDAAETTPALAAVPAARRDARRCTRPTPRSCRPGAPPRCCRTRPGQLGAELRDHSPVLGLDDLGDAGRARSPRPTRDGALPGRGRHRRRVGQRRARPPRAARAARRDARAGHLLRGRAPRPVRTGRMPLWIWMDDPSFYGFPTYGEPTIKAAQDCGGPVVDPDRRPDQRPRPGDAGPAHRSCASAAARGRASRCGRCAASTR